MICLTIDMISDERHINHSCLDNCSSAQILLRFLNLLESVNISATVFLSPQTLLIDYEILQEICDNPVVEIGGHNLRNHLWLPYLRSGFDFESKAKNINEFRYKFVQDTIESIYKKTGRRIRAWRNSNLRSQAYDSQILADCGILVCTGTFDCSSYGPTWNDAGILQFPINIDSELQRAHLFSTQNLSTSPSHPSQVEQDDSQDGELWAIDVLDNLSYNEMNGIISHLSINPIELYVFDQFQTFEDYLLDYLVMRDTFQISRIYDWEIQRIHYGNRKN